MSEKLESLPLYLLTTVVFPYTQTRLTITDETFQKLVRECVRDDKRLGIVLVRSQTDPYLVGTRAKIVGAVVAPSGDMEIVVLGENRFRIRKLEDAEGHLRGMVEPVIESDTFASEYEKEELVRDVSDTFRSLISKTNAYRGLELRINLPSEPAPLSFAIASALPIDNLGKQRLLEMTDSNERLRDLHALLSAQLLEARQHSYRKIQASELQGFLNPN